MGASHYAPHHATVGTDHVGFVVPDLDAAIRWLTDVFGFAVAIREPDTWVDAHVMGHPSQLQLRGALLTANGFLPVELHQFLSPPTSEHDRDPFDEGIGHFAVQVTDIDHEMSRLQSHGVHWRVGPNYIPHGPYAHRRWVYGYVPALRAVLELLQNPPTQTPPPTNNPTDTITVATSA